MSLVRTFFCPTDPIDLANGYHHTEVNNKLDRRKSTVPTPRALVAARLTIGVSSVPRVTNILIISARTFSPALGYGAANKAQADVLDVNQSPPLSVCSSGRNFCSRCSAERSSEILAIDSAAYRMASVRLHRQIIVSLTLSLTKVSSTAARFSKGPRMVQAH